MNSAEREQKQKRGKEVDKRRLEREFMSRLRHKLSETGYCRDGFIILEKEIDYRRSKLDGQCHETATAEDLKRFPNR